MNSQMDRRNFISMSAATAVGGLVSASDVLSPASSNIENEMKSSVDAPLIRRPNIVFFMPDEMRADSLACYGNLVTKTPSFDMLAKTGARFSNCHVQYPVCGASRCSMLTGWPTSVRGHRSLYYFLRPEEPNLFRYLRQSGYDVFWFGKNDALAAQSFANSVTEWHDLDIPISEVSPKGLTPNSLSMLYASAGDRRQTRDFKLVQMAIKIIERKESDRPFCIFLPLTEPHPPYTVPRDFYDMYSPSDLPALIPPGLPHRPRFHQGIRKMYGLTTLADEVFRKVRAVYYAQVSYSDWLLGEIMSALASSGRNKDTALFVMSDHGDYAGDYGLIEKWPSGLEDSLTHVPLIVRLPGGPAGAVAEGMVELFDIMQTSLDLAGANANHTHFSRSLIPQLTGMTGELGRSAFAEGGYNVYEPQCFEPPGAGGSDYTGKIRLQNETPVTVSRSSMIRTRTHKLIMRPQDECELYSYEKDPREENNLYNDSSVSSIEHDLQKKLLDHYINTTGIAPTDKDPRDCPPFYPTRSDLITSNWQRNILDAP